MNKETGTLQEAGEPPVALVTALRLIIVALVRLLLRFQVVYPQLLEMLKSAYVQVAEGEYRLQNKPQTDTRLSLLTGIHRKDIKRLRSQLGAEVEEPLAISQGVRIVARWIGEPGYQLKNGQPAPLPFKSVDGPSFESLVQEVCRQDLRPRVVLDEWLRLGIVSEDEKKRLTLNADAFVPGKSIDEKSFFLGMNISDHLNAASHNMQEGAEPYFERCVYYDELSEASIKELSQLAKSRGMETLKVINTRASELKARDKKQGGGRHRINVGVYSFDEEVRKHGEDES